MRVVGIQFDIAWEDPTANFKRVEPLIEQAAAAGADLVILPEMFATGFSMDAAAVARHAPAIREAVQGLARHHGVHILAGLAAPAGDGVENCAVILDPDGHEVLRYAKIHPFTLAGEDRHFIAGNDLPVVEIAGARVCALICYDLRFPEPFRAVAAATDLFCVIANWPVPRSSAWRALLRARAIENQAYCAGVNRVGEGDGHQYRGDSAIVDPFGQCLAARAWQHGLVVADVAPKSVAAARAKFSFLKDRRPEVYRDLESPPGD